jgi:hypothetical protein
MSFHRILNKYSVYDDMTTLCNMFCPDELEEHMYSIRQSQVGNRLVVSHSDDQSVRKGENETAADEEEEEEEEEEELLS